MDTWLLNHMELLGILVVFAIIGRRHQVRWMLPMDDCLTHQ